VDGSRVVIAALPSTLVEMRFSSVAFRLRIAIARRPSPQLPRVRDRQRYSREGGQMLELGPELLERYRSLSEQFYREDKSLAIRRSGWAYGLSLLASGVCYLGYLVMALAAARGAITLGNLTLYVMAFPSGTAGLSVFSRGDRQHVRTQSVHVEPVRLPRYPRDTAAGVISTRRKSGVTSEGIRLERSDSVTPAARDGHCEIFHSKFPRNKSLALVGHNGAGKSTFYQAALRSLRSDRRDESSSTGSTCDSGSRCPRRRISVVFQDFNRYQFTLRENIGLGSLPNRQNEAQLRRAVEMESGGTRRIALRGARHGAGAMVCRRRRTFGRPVAKNRAGTRFHARASRHLYPWTSPPPPSMPKRNKRFSKRFRN